MAVSRADGFTDLQGQHKPDCRAQAAGHEQPLVFEEGQGERPRDSGQPLRPEHMGKLPPRMAGITPLFPERIQTLVKEGGVGPGKKAEGDPQAHLHANKPGDAVREGRAGPACRSNAASQQQGFLRPIRSPM
jgi:hypothetical protein